MFLPAARPAGRQSSTVATLRGLPDGPAATAATLRYMRDFARAAVADPKQTIRELALDLVSNLPERDWFGQIHAVRNFVRSHIRYVRDPDDMETLQTPEKTLEYGQGDCDDQCILLAALLKSIGHPARFVALGFGGGPFSHVLTETKVNSTGNDRVDWIAVETIIDKPPGWFPPGVTSKYILKV